MRRFTYPAIALRRPARASLSSGARDPYALGCYAPPRHSRRRIGDRLCRGRALAGRQLDHSRVLAWPQPGDKHGPPIGEFQCVMMRIGIAQVDLPKPSHIGPKLTPAWQQPAEDMIVFGFPIEHHLRARQQADRDPWLPDRGKAARRRTDE